LINIGFQNRVNYFFDDGNQSTRIYKKEGAWLIFHHVRKAFYLDAIKLAKYLSYKAGMQNVSCFHQSRRPREANSCKEAEEEPTGFEGD